MPEIDVHGLRYEEAREAVLRFVDRLVFEDENCGLIIHGLGVIVEALEEWLSDYPHVARLERQLGNSGATLVWMDL